MKNSTPLRLILMATLTALIAVAAGCSMPTPTPTPAPTATTSTEIIVVPSATPLPATPTPEPTATQPPRGNAIYWGALLTDGERSAPWNPELIDQLESLADKKLSILHWGQSWWSCNESCGYQFFSDQVQQYDAVRSRGMIPLVDWGSFDPWAKPNEEQPNFALSTIIDGSHDGYIREWATQAMHWGHPFFLRFDWEMNGDWFPWSEEVNGNKAGEYVKAWRHVHDIFTRVGANNVTWVWCPNVYYDRDVPIAPLYPGDGYVDWIGMDGYNWGTDPVQPDSWRSFQHIFGSTYDELTRISIAKPIMIAETSSTEKGGSKAAWITDALETQVPAHFPKVKALVWFNWNTDGMDWVVQSSEASQKAFASAIKSPYYSGEGFENLNVSPIPPLQQLP